MKLSIDCIRDVLIALEENLVLDENHIIQSIEFESFCTLLPQYSENDVFYTCQKLDEANYIEFDVLYAGNSAYYSKFPISHLTVINFLKQLGLIKFSTKQNLYCPKSVASRYLQFLKLLLLY